MKEGGTHDVNSTCVNGNDPGSSRKATIFFAIFFPTCGIFTRAFSSPVLSVTINSR